MTDNRHFEPWITDGVRRNLESLVRHADVPETYRTAMHALGVDLALELSRHFEGTRDLVLICTAEDADYLARGVLERLTMKHTVHVVCYWSERFTVAGREMAPIIGRYVEPLNPAQLTDIVIVKSIISSSCSVRTHLTEFLDEVKAQVPIYIVAPVMYREAPHWLEREFPRRISRQFRYLTCAVDDVRLDDGIVVPGIGGSVYRNLGLGDVAAKNRLRPRLIAVRSVGA